VFVLGAQYFVNDEKFFYGYFQGNKLNKILKSGKGYPRKLFGKKEQNKIKQGEMLIFY